jgi:hypothetical protein
MLTLKPILSLIASPAGETAGKHRTGQAAK